ncbi:MAG: OmpH family outer membrane protein [Candidatus Margulisbacteria bacterium]|jgi:outer membrane protein|nr:OmpH family outer membrane protein [Candidatus Margulisiibacteriota bacterium]
MKLAKIILSLAVLVSVSLAATVGYIDVKQVFEGYSKTKSVQDDLNNKMKDYEKLRNKHAQKLTEAKIDGKTEKDLEKLQEDMKKELGPKETEIQMINDEQMAKIRKDIVAAVDAISKEVGIDVVVDKQVIITGGMDLTEQVITRLNKKK